MKQNSKKKKFGAALTALLCVPLTLGIAAGCNGGSMKQSTVQNSAPVSYTGLHEVTLSDPYTLNAMELEREYLLETLDADKLLYYFHKNADLEPKAASSYGGQWEGALIGGHTMGHYLSALAQAYGNANTPSTGENSKADLQERIDYIVGELKRCQDNAVTAGAKEGFIWGAPAPSANPNNPEAQFDFVEANQADIFTQAWVPWYTMHKILQGLIDVANYTGSATAKEVATKLGDWVYDRATGWSNTTQKTVLGIEYGGMNDSLYNLYALTGEDKYAVAAHKFDEDALFEKVTAAKKNYLTGLHANTTIPKIIGALNRYMLCDGKTVGGEEIDASEYLAVAENFWDYVIEHHTYITGGNSKDEHFVQDDKLDLTRADDNCETCNTYNMLKLSRMLFTITHDKKYLDYYERTYYNAILSSQNPETGMTTYFQPMGTGYFKVYSSPTNHFWCCTGSGMESFTKLNDSIYYEAGNAVYVSLYVASAYQSDSVSLTQTADLENSDSVKVHIDSGSTVLRLRKPDWTKSFAVDVNGKNVEIGQRDAFVSVDVKAGDDVTVQMEKTVQAEPLPDNVNSIAFRYGPFALSAELGDYSMTEGSHGVNVSVPNSANVKKTYSIPADDIDDFIDNISNYMIKGANNKFTLACKDGTLTYSYHFRQYRQRYGLYFEFIEGEVEEAEPAWIWTRYSDAYRPGYGQGEVGLEDNGSTAVSSAPIYNSTRYANANGSFSYSSVKVEKGKQNRLVVYFAKADNGKTMLVKSGNTQIYSATLNYSGNEDMYAVEIKIPDSVVSASDGTINLTFSGINNAESARLCSSFYIESYSFNNKSQDSSVAYFVDCGDYDTTTLSGKDKLGVNQSVTEQAYGKDSVTGKSWGIVDNYQKTWSGTNPQGVYTNSTWAYEYNTEGDGVDKTASNRYTKEQNEKGLARKLGYKFELANGAYTVKMYFANPWNNAANPTVKANGETKITNGAVNEELTFSVTVTDGELTLDITSSSLCINLAYIQILFA